jgi:hypothetical protein
VPADQSECDDAYVKPWGKLDACRPVARGSDPRPKSKKGNGVSVSFVPAYTQLSVGKYQQCAKHKLLYSINKGKVKGINLKKGKNVAFISNLQEGDVVTWHVQPLCKNTVLTPGSPRKKWKFHVLDPSVTTTTTTTTIAEACEDVDTNKKYQGKANVWLNKCKLQMKRLAGILKNGKTTTFCGADFTGVDHTKDADLQRALYDKRTSMNNDYVAGGSTCPRRC